MNFKRCTGFGDDPLAVRIKRMAFAMTTLTVAILGSLLLGLTLHEIPDSQTTSNQHAAGIIGDVLSEDIRHQLNNIRQLSRTALVKTALTDSASRDAYLIPFLKAGEKDAHDTRMQLVDQRGHQLLGDLPHGIAPEQRDALLALVLAEKESHRVVVTDNGRTLLLAGFAVTAAYSGETIGALVGTIDLSDLFRRRAAGLGHGLGLELVFGGNTVVAHPARPLAASPRFFPVAFPLALGDDALTDALTLGVHSTVNPWQLLILRQVILWALLAVLLGFLVWRIAGVAAQRMTHRLNRLAESCTALSEGRQDPLPEDTACDEIGVLSRTLHAAVASYERITAELEKRVEQKTRELSLSEARFRSFFEKNASVMLIIDPVSGQIIAANGAAAAYYGYPLEQMIGLSMSEINAMPLDRLAEESERALREDGDYFLFVHRLASGELRDVEVYLTPIEHDERPLMFTVIHDITERKLARQALQESEQRFRQAFVHAPIGIAVVALDGVVSEANSALCRLLGYDAGELAGIALDQLFRDPIPEREWLRWDASADDDTSAVSQERIGLRRDGGHIPVIFTLTQVRDARHQPSKFIVRIEDISKRKQAELQNLATGILIAQEQGRALLSHELHDAIGQSLTALKMTLKRAQHNLADPDKAEACLVTGQYMLEGLMKEVRSIAYRLRPAEIDQLGLAAALRSHLDKTMRPLGLNVTLTENLGETRLPALLELCCFRVVQEALTNGLRHAQASQIDVSLVRESARLTLSIKDNGIGLDIRQYYSALENPTSLGLIGMRERVAANGGQLQIRSAPGAGTEVVATFEMTGEPA